MSGQTVTIPDDRAFASFKAECLCEEGWSVRYSKLGITVWSQDLEEGKSVHKIKCQMVCKDVSAETMYDVLHDIEYRKKWDTNVIETFDIGKLTVNADVGYYSWRCPSPLKNRDVITLRSWLPIAKDYIIMNYSVKHAKYPPKKEMVRAVSLQTGYMVQWQGPNRCILTYLAQVDPRGSLPKWVVNRSSHYLAPRAMKKINKACLKYPEWKQRHNPGYKPWLYPEQTTLPSIPLSELSIQRAESLEKIDESSLAETQDREADSD
ncbi:START domain-containing protein 10 [Acanthopagrus latus]|uniref:START domain-containing protein 10 n=1 Tax=Acanthopagrus latus TaxID=8177 RepID=UPI00187BFD89|nr:START domain-containing protein 10 [Acanthopagrus latus]